MQCVVRSTIHPTYFELESLLTLCHTKYVGLLGILVQQFSFCTNSLGKTSINHFGVAKDDIL